MLCFLLAWRKAGEVTPLSWPHCPQCHAHLVLLELAQSRPQVFHITVKGVCPHLFLHQFSSNFKPKLTPDLFESFVLMPITVISFQQQFSPLSVCPSICSTPSLYLTKLSAFFLSELDSPCTPLIVLNPLMAPFTVWILPSHSWGKRTVHTILMRSGLPLWNWINATLDL